MLPAREFDAAKTLELMTLHSSSGIVATAEQVAALDAALAVDAANPAAKRKFNLSALRGGLVGECVRSFFFCVGGGGYYFRSCQVEVVRCHFHFLLPPNPHSFSAADAKPGSSISLGGIPLKTVAASKLSI